MSDQKKKKSFRPLKPNISWACNPWTHTKCLYPVCLKIYYFINQYLKQIFVVLFEDWAIQLVDQLSDTNYFSMRILDWHTQDGLCLEVGINIHLRHNEINNAKSVSHILYITPVFLYCVLIGWKTSMQKHINSVCLLFCFVANKKLEIPFTCTIKSVHV